MAEHIFSFEMRNSLQCAGWFPGRTALGELAAYKFELHREAKEFVAEFGDIYLNRTLDISAIIPNSHHPRLMKAFLGVGLAGCVPVAGCNYATDSSMWIGEDGRVYLADEEQINLVGMTVDEGMEILAMRKEIPTSYPAWYVESYFD